MLQAELIKMVRWEDYTKAKEDMFARTNIAEASWFIVEANRQEAPLRHEHRTECRF